MLIYKVRTEFFLILIFLIIHMLQTGITCIMFAVLNIAYLQTHLMRSLAKRQME